MTGGFRASRSLQASGSSPFLSLRSGLGLGHLQFELAQLPSPWNPRPSFSSSQSEGLWHTDSSLRLVRGPQTSCFLPGLGGLAKAWSPTLHLSPFIVLDLTCWGGGLSTFLVPPSRIPPFTPTIGVANSHLQSTSMTPWESKISWSRVVVF